jgi:methionyl-tRNA formyltransferase
VLLARSTPIGPEETAPELEPRLARLGGEVLLETLAALAAGGLEPIPQDHSRATLAPLLKKEDGRLDWRRPAATLAWRIRGFQPWPGAAATCEGHGLQVRRARIEAPGPGEPGTIVQVDREGIVVACGESTRLRLLEVQPESRRAMPAAAFAAGARLKPGGRLDP